MKKITPFLWFNGNAEAAATFYTSIFPNSKTLDVMRYTSAGPRPRGSVMSVTFELQGQEFIALNGGPSFSFTPAISFFAHCDSQEEIDALWSKLAEGGRVLQCGWVTDKFGITWQIVPVALGEMLHDPDQEKASRVMEALMKMDKLDITVLKQAYNG